MARGDRKVGGKALVAAIAGGLLVAPTGAHAAKTAFVELSRDGGANAAPIVRAVTPRPVGRLRARLNGTRAGAAFESLDGRRWTASIDADHGLRHGRNRLVVSAPGHRGSSRMGFAVRRTTPVAGAGELHYNLAHDQVRLDGRPSRPAEHGNRLDFRWSVVSAPDGLEPELRRADAARPTFIPSVHGTYELELRVRERTGGREPRQGDAATAVDLVTVHTGPDVEPTGVPIDTVLSEQEVAELGGQGIVIGDSHYPASGASGSQCELETGGAAGWIQMLVLSRATLDCKRQYLFGLADASALKSAVNGTSAEEIVVLTGGARRQSSLGGGRDALESVYKTLGGTLRPFRSSGDRGFEDGEFSLIGSKVAPPGSQVEGAAAQAQSFATAGAEALGSLDGYMQRNGELLYAFAFGQYESFDTSAPDAPAGTNVVEVAGRRYSSTDGGLRPLAPGEAGFQVVVLDQQSLEPIEQITPITNHASGEQNLGAERALPSMVAILKKYLDRQDPVTVIVQSIGHPHVRHHEWTDDLAPTLRELGATRDLVAGLDGSHGYTLVGGTKLPGDGYGQEASDQLNPGSPPRLVGVLSRNRQGQFSSLGAGPEHEIDQGIYELAYGTSEAEDPWPGAGDEGETAALAYIFRKLGEAQPFKDPTDLRDNYVLERAAADWGDRAQQLGQVGYPETRDPGFTYREFTDTQSQLAAEFGDVQQIRGLVDRYQSVYTTQDVQGQIDVESIAQDVEDDISPPQDARTSVSMEEITRGILEYGEGVAGTIPGVGEVAAAPFEALTAVNSIVSAFESTGGIPVTVRIEEKAGQLKSELGDRFAITQRNLDIAGDMLVANWGALQAAAGKATTDWTLTQDAQDLLADATSAGIKREVYGALVPIAYDVYDLYPQDGDPGITRANDYECLSENNIDRIKVFGTAPSQSQVPVTYGYHDHLGRRNVHPHVLAADAEDVLDEGGRVVIGRTVRKYPSKGTLAKMFTSVAAGGAVGLNQVTFFERYFDAKRFPCAQ